MYIQIKLVSNKSIYIKLFDNYATKKWFEKFSSYKFASAGAVNDAYNHTNTSNLTESPTVLNKINSDWSNIKLTLQKLKDSGLNTDLFNLPDFFNFDQTLLNQLHRFFTYNVLWLHNEDNIDNPFDPNFKRESLNHNWHDLISIINTSVHNLETYVTTPNSNILNRYPLEYLQVQLNPQPTSNSWIGFNLEEQQENYKYQEYKKNFKNPLVILDNSILGKSYLQSFLDHDDPTSVDCTGRVGSHGNFHIEIDDNRNNLYASKDFKEWLSHYNIVNPPLEFPIGMIIEPAPESLKSIIQLTVEDVVFFTTWSG
jgi:hypothetical protein